MPPQPSTRINQPVVAMIVVLEALDCHFKPNSLRICVSNRYR